MYKDKVISLLRKSHIILAWVILCSVLLTSGLANQQKVLSWPSDQSIDLEYNTDIWLRLTQVKQWVTTPDFYDHTIHNTNAPYGNTQTPWTRPMDSIIAAGYLLTPDTYPVEKRLMLSATWAPLFLGILFVFVLTKAANYKFKNPYHTGIIICCLLIFPFELNVFNAGDADHHGLQILLFSIVLALLLSRQTTKNAAFMGATLGIWTWVSPELLMFLIPLCLLWGAQIIHGKQNPRYAATASLSGFITLLAGLMIEKPPSDFWIVEYDTLSIAYVSFFLTIFIGFFALLKICTATPNVIHRYVGALSVGIILALCFHLIFPLFYKGPLASINPELFWINIASRTLEALPIWMAAPRYIYATLALPLIAALLSFCYARKDPAVFLLFAISLASIFVQMRWFYYLEAVSILIIARFLPSFLRHTRRKWNKSLHLFLVPYALLLLIFVIGYRPHTPESILQDKRTTIENACKASLLYNVQMGGLEHMIGNKDATILSNFIQLGGSILFFTPYKIPTAYFHREVETADEMRRLLEDSTRSDAKIILSKRKINYLLICPQRGSWINEFFDPAAKDPNWVEDKRYLPTAPNRTEYQDYRPLLIKLKFSE